MACVSTAHALVQRTSDVCMRKMLGEEHVERFGEAKQQQGCKDTGTCLGLSPPARSQVASLTSLCTIWRVTQALAAALSRQRAVGAGLGEL